MKFNLPRLGLLVALVIAPTQLLAASGGGAHDAHAIPWGAIGIQILNLGILLGILAWALRKTIRTHFEIRHRTYLELVQKAEKAKAEAEENRRVISKKLEQLENTARASVERAQAEASQLKERIIQEAKELSEKLQYEAERAVALELDRAKIELRQELLSVSIEAAQKVLKDSIDVTEQKKLQDEFLGKIQVVS